MGFGGSADLDREGEGGKGASKNRDKLESGKRSMEFLCCGGGSVRMSRMGCREQAGTMAAAAASVAGPSSTESDNPSGNNVSKMI